MRRQSMSAARSRCSAPGSNGVRCTPPTTRIRRSSPNQLSLKGRVAPLFPRAVQRLDSRAAWQARLTGLGPLIAFQPIALGELAGLELISPRHHPFDACNPPTKASSLCARFCRGARGRQSRSLPHCVCAAPRHPGACRTACDSPAFPPRPLNGHRGRHWGGLTIERTML